ncbi:21 kDa seed protein-like [Telopea speciosissima]|uniref:21 kDa seed protein-like n=1 Tax=Telopea speciosissima TaxID=54955 RepID=UPI001CC404EF|nr:21 kDa seed protein-like [Telopea speciosissima]
MWNRALVLLGLPILAFVQVIDGFSHHHHHHHHHRFDHQSAVHDTDGNKLQAGMSYYIVSAIRGGGGGGVSPGRRESSTSQSHTAHTPTVKQSSYDRNMGTPVMFSPASSEHPELELPSVEEEETMIIRESMDMNICFSGMDNRAWQVEERREQSSGWWWSSSKNSSLRYVTVKGKPGHPGESTVRNWFRIERISEGSPVYRIVYCPNVCESCHVVCGRVGITKENGERWLSVSEHREFPFVFVRARQSHDNNSKDE